MLIKVVLVTQKFTGLSLWMTALKNKVKYASSLDEDLGWALTSPREVSDLELHGSLVLSKEWGRISLDCGVFWFIFMVFFRRPIGQAHAKGNKGFHKMQLI